MAEFKGSELDMSRTRRLEIERNKQKQQLEQRKRDIKNQNKLNLTTINNRFAGKSDYAEELLKQETIGLVTLDDFNKKQLDIQLEERKRKREQKKKTKKKKKKEVQAAKLSFDFDDGDEEEEDILEMPAKRKKKEKEEDGKAAEEEVIAAKGIGKDPTAMTSFLPDKERDQWERDTRLLLKKQFLLEQEQIKQELIDVTYSYWDGSGHRKVVTVKKGLRIDQFLDKVRQEFPELRSVSVESLLFVKEDLIIPHQITFYDLIISKARGKSGPLFDWTVHDDVRVVSDASKEKQESHAAKVVERRWYERNKHIFPASRWEIYDPAVQRESYTIRDTKKKATD